MFGGECVSVIMEINMKIGKYALLSILLVACMMFSIGCVNINTDTDTSNVDETTNSSASDTAS